MKISKCIASEASANDYFSLRIRNRWWWLTWKHRGVGARPAVREWSRQPQWRTLLLNPVRHTTVQQSVRVSSRVRRDPTRTDLPATCCPRGCSDERSLECRFGQIEYSLLDALPPIWIKSPKNSWYFNNLITLKKLVVRNKSGNLAVKNLKQCIYIINHFFECMSMNSQR